MTADEAIPEKQDEQPFRYMHTTGVAELLAAAGVSLWVTTYQAGKLAVFRARDRQLSMLPRTFDKAMGLAVRRDRLALATRYQVWSLRNETILAPRIKPKGEHDACYLPRSSHVTGNIDAHEIAWGNNSALWIVNTLFSCLCTLDPEFSFVPRWRPPFVSQLVRQDRCHLNGLAMADGRPKYATAFAESDTAEGWREHKRTGGVLVDIPSGEIVARGLSMPHSPRIYQGRVWLLDSGNGRLVTVDPDTGKIDTVAELPGYTRGLAFCNGYAFVGLSRIRETSIFGGIPIADRLEERKCGVWIVDLNTGRSAGNIEFESTVDEIFDVQILHGVRYPAVVGFAKRTVERACVIGPAVPLEHSQADSSGTVSADMYSAGSRQGEARNADVALVDSPEFVQRLDAKSLNERGRELYRSGQREQAAECFRRAVELQPDYATALSNLGNILTELDKPDEAEVYCCRAVAVDPHYATAHNNLGYALLKQERMEEAAASFERAVELRPDYLLAQCNLGRALQAARCFEDAEAAWRRGLQLQPRSVDALCGLGDALLSLDRPGEAIGALEAALQVEADRVQARNDLGLARMRLGMTAEAIADYQRALQLAPDNTRVHCNLAYALLARGEFQQAWPHFEWRLRDKPASDPPLTQPVWDGSPLAERTILLHTEQGLGDTIQFVRLARQLRAARISDADREHPGKMILACQPSLVPLLSTCPGIDQVVPKDGLVPACDVHAPLMSLPAILGITLETIPADVPYLFPRADLQAQWREELDQLHGLKIGIAWQGNPEYPDDRARSIPLTQFATLTEVEGVTLVSLQKGFGSEQLADVDFPVADWGSCLDEQSGAFEETAAVVSQLDLVISSDTSIVHLAGALGAPVWVAIAHVADWRYLLNIETSPWYPTMRLFRQRDRGNWESVFQQMKRELQHKLAQALPGD